MMMSGVKKTRYRKSALLTLAILALSGCFKKWTEEERQQFREACQKQENVSDYVGGATFQGFEREEIRTVKVEHIRAGAVIDTFVVATKIATDVRNRILYDARIDRPLLRQDTLRFIVPSQVFTLSDFKIDAKPVFTMLSEDWFCGLSAFTLNGEIHTNRIYFVKSGYRDYVMEEPIMNTISPDSGSDEWLLLLREQQLLLRVRNLLLLADAVLAEEEDSWDVVVFPVAEGLAELGDHYVTPEIIDDSGMKLVAAQQAENEGDWKTALLIRHEVLKARYAMFQEKIGVSHNAPEN
jgi:hypothetical protein